MRTVILNVSEEQEVGEERSASSGQAKCDTRAAKSEPRGRRAATHENDAGRDGAVTQRTGEVTIV
jgi:hypothetical protein